MSQLQKSTLFSELLNCCYYSINTDKHYKYMEFCNIKMSGKIKKLPLPTTLKLNLHKSRQFKKNDNTNLLSQCC